MSWSIREVKTPEEIEVVRTLFREYEAWLGVDLCFQDFETELATLPGKYGYPEGSLVLAYLDREPVGCAALRPLQGRQVCEMKRLYVQPHARGRGIGLGLARRILRDGQKIGYKRIRLDTLARMEDAIRLYTALGFYEIGPYRDNPLKDAVFMERTL